MHCEICWGIIDMTKHTLQQDLQSIETDTEARDIFRLAQARNNALAQRSPVYDRVLRPVLGVSIMSVLLLSFFLMQNLANTNLEAVNPQYVNDFSEQSIDIYEDLEFYYWLAESQQSETG
jgi:hypothetical protein